MQKYCWSALFHPHPARTTLLMGILEKWTFLSGSARNLAGQEPIGNELSSNQRQNQNLSPSVAKKSGNLSQIVVPRQLTCLTIQISSTGWQWGFDRFLNFLALWAAKERGCWKEIIRRIRDEVILINCLKTQLPKREGFLICYFDSRKKFSTILVQRQNLRYISWV